MLACGGTTSHGSVTLKRLPWPSVLSTQTLPPSMRLSELAHQRQAQPGSLVLPAERAVDLREGLEETGEISFGNPNTSIPLVAVSR